jgi:hypothetical protein
MARDALFNKVLCLNPRTGIMSLLTKRSCMFVVPPSGRKRAITIHFVIGAPFRLKAGLRTYFVNTIVYTRRTLNSQLQTVSGRWWLTEVNI